jgi:hypothetical protein
VKTKQLTFLLALTFLYLFSSSSLAEGSQINCREDAEEIPHNYEDSCVYEANAGKVFTFDLKIKESHGDGEIIDIPYSNLRHAGAIIQIYYTVGAMGKAQWFPIPSMNGVVVMNNSLMLPMGKWKKRGMLPGTFLRVVIFKSE